MPSLSPVPPETEPALPAGPIPQATERPGGDNGSRAPEGRGTAEARPEAGIPVAEIRLEPGRISASVTLPGEAGPSEVVITPAPLAGELRRRACEMLLDRKGWREPFDAGGAVDHESLAASLAKNLRAPYLDWERMPALCPCAAGGGGCAHTEAAVAKARETVSASHLKGLLAHGFDLRAWADSDEVREAAVEPRELSASWRTDTATWKRAKAGDPPDLFGIPFMLEDILRLLKHAPDDWRSIDCLRQGMVLASEYAEEIERADPEAVRAPDLGAPLAVAIGEDCRVCTLVLGSEPRRLAFKPLEERLVRFLALAHPNRLGKAPANERFWALLLDYAVVLAQQCAAVPEQVRGLDGEELFTVWRPATMLSGEVRETHRWFVENCPPDLLVMRVGEEGRTLRASAEIQVRHAVDILYRGLALPAMRRDHEGQRYEDLEYYEGDLDPLVCMHLFRWWDGPFDMSPSKGEKEECHAWLRRLWVPERLPGVSLRVEPDPGDPARVALRLAFRDEEGEPAPLEELLGRRATPHFLLALRVASETLGADVDGDESLDCAVAGIPLDGLVEFLGDRAPRLEMSGIPVELADEFGEGSVPKAGYRMTLGDHPSSGLFDLTELVKFDWAVAIGGHHVSVEEFRELLRKARKDAKMSYAFRHLRLPVAILHTGKGYVRFGPGDLDEDPTKSFGKLPQPSHFELLRAALTGEHLGASVHMDRGAQRIIRDILSPRERPPPPGGLADRLRPYQVTGFEWLAQNADVGFGSILADDMGLGKTVQAIALALHRTLRDPSHKTLVVAPPALLTNWLREIRRFAPTLRTQIYHGTSRSLDVDAHDVVLSSYGVARRDAVALCDRRWGLMVVDEAQNIKNPATKQAKAIKDYRAEAHVALTGTPVENHLDDYWSVFDYTNRGYLGSLRGFRSELARPIENYRDKKALDRFRKLTGPFVLRRLKTDKSIVGDLPEKIEGVRYCSLTPRQAALYQEAVEAMMRAIRGAGDEDDPRNMQRRGLIFKMLTALKQICNSPAHYLGHGSAPPSESGKLSLCLETLAELADTDEKALIFTQYVEMGKLLVDAVRADTGEEPLFLHGGLARTKRDEIVDAFQGDPSKRNMVLSLKAGGTGLNLTAATQVIHYDRWWNPAVERQATDRAHRIGQTRRVQVHLLVTENTLEEKIDEMLKKKGELADLTVQSGDKWLTDMTNRQLRNLVELTKPLA